MKILLVEDSQDFRHKMKELLEDLHNYINKKLQDKNSIIKEFLYCPHYPKKLIGADLTYIKKCSCRKPGNKLIEDMIMKYNIDREKSWFIGDQTSDILAGQNSNLKTLLFVLESFVR